MELVQWHRRLADGSMAGSAMRFNSTEPVETPTGEPPVPLPCHCRYFKYRLSSTWNWWVPTSRLGEKRPRS